MRVKEFVMLMSGLVLAGIAHAQTGPATPQSGSTFNPAPETRSAPNPPPDFRPRPAFKGKWNGPTKVIIPGPGPQLGQSMGDYFANLVSGDRKPIKRHVLVLGGSRGFHHDSVTSAMASIFQSGKSTGWWDAEFATDYSLVNAGGGQKMNAGFQPKGLKDFDAVVVAGASGDWGLSDDQKAALISFVRDEGKGLVVIHAGLNANSNWQDYVDMVGGEMTGHPFNTPDKVLVPFKIINESPDFPAVSHLPRSFRKQDELYAIKNWDRSDVNVLLRLDTSDLDTKSIESQLPPDLDIPVAWTKRYGKGRVFVSSIGHHAEAFDDPDVVKMYAEAVKWSLGLTEGDERPHVRR